MSRSKMAKKASNTFALLSLVHLLVIDFIANEEGNKYKSKKKSKSSSSKSLSSA